MTTQKIEHQLNSYIIGLDTSTSNMGVAVFNGDELIETRNFKYKGVFSYDKLRNIVQDLEDYILTEYSPCLVVIEEPAPVRHSKAVSSLNMVAGAVFSKCISYSCDVRFIHNKTIKRLMKVKTKDESVNKVKKMYGIRRKITDHESDACLAVEAYKILRKENDCKN